MLKKFTTLICILLALLMCASCSNDQSGDNPEQNNVQVDVIPLTTEEAELLEAFGDDLQIVSEEDYPNTVTELQYHADDYSGQVFQIEGILKTTTINGVETPFVYRTLNNAGEKTECGLPLKYLEKEISDGSWVSVTAIINTEDYNGSTQTVMEVVAIEAPANTGNAELNWTGSQHNH